MTRKEEIENLAQEHEKELSSCYQSFVLGAYYADKTMVDKACKWLQENVKAIHPRKGTECCLVNLTVFKEAMEQ